MVDFANIGDQGFAFIGGALFRGAGAELRILITAAGLRVEADADGDGSADLSLFLRSAISVTAADFVL